MLPEVREFARAAGPPAGARDLGGTVTVRIGPQTHCLLGRTCGDIVVFTFADPAGPRCGRHPFRRQPEEGEIVIDFNRTVVPGCCFSPICPEPEIPAQNRLDIPVVAGERAVRWGGAAACRPGVR